MKTIIFSINILWVNEILQKLSINRVFTQPTSLHYRVWLTQFGRSIQGKCNLGISLSKYKYGGGRSTLHKTKNPDSLKSSLELLGNRGLK
jgi:hypothetical protein